MPVTANNITYTNGNSGRTRVNEQGLIVGVDFSTTSNPITTGSKTFTLTATAGVNRDWPVGSTLVAVAQAGATGSLIGTVTSYDPATQVLVMNAASVTGSGTSTDWRIGSTMYRELTPLYDFRNYNPLTLQPASLVEGGATNTVSDTRLSGNALLNGLIRRLNAGVAPNGITEATELESGTAATESNSGTIRNVGANSTANVPNGQSVFVKVINLIGGTGFLYMGSSSRPLEFRLNLATMTGAYRRNTSSGANTTDTPLVVQPYPNGWFRILAPGHVNDTGNENRILFEGAIGSTIQIWCPQVEIGSSVCSSPIPTTTVSVTRAADQASVTGANFGQLYNPTQGTMVFEVTPIASAVGAVVGSLNDGTLNNAIRVQQKNSGTLSSIRKMATDGVTDVMAINASTGNTLRSNGVDYTEVADQSATAKLGVASASTGNFLAVGATENFRNSTDSGLTYNARTIGGTFGGAHFGIGRFVIAGSTSVINGATVGSVIVSTDGLALRRVNIHGLTQQLQEITSNGTNQYVAVGNAGVIYTSPDAETWTPQTSGTATNLTGAAHFSGRYVVTSATANATRYSDNGTSWTAVTGLAAGMNDVAHNGTNLWVAVGSGGAIYSSADGISYTVQTSNTTQTLNGVHFADGLWVAVGNLGTVVTSPNGTTWTDRTANSGATSPLSEVNFFSGKFYFIGDGTVLRENTAANIVANVTWTSRTANIVSNLNGIAANGTRLLICGSAGGISTSDDGTTFASRTGNAATLNGASFGNGTYVVVGNAVNGSGLIATVSPTTFEYQRRVSNFTSNVSAVAFVNGRFFAGGTSAMGHSTDGITWTTTVIAGAVLGVAFGNGVYVGVGTAGRLLTSTDLITYANTTGQIGAAQANDVSFANGIFVAVNAAGGIYTSTTGLSGSWTLRASGVTTALYTVMFSTRDNVWYAAGDNGTILRASDPTGTWTSIANDATVGIFTAGALQANPLAGKFIPNQRNRVAIAWDSTGVYMSINGGDVVSDPSVTMPTLTQYSIGMNGVSGAHWNSSIKTQRAYRVRSPNAELQALSRI